MHKWISLKLWLVFSLLMGILEYDKSQTDLLYFEKYGLATIFITIVGGGFFWALIANYIKRKITKT
jgi:hypothetical protein